MSSLWQSGAHSCAWSRRARRLARSVTAVLIAAAPLTWSPVHADDHIDELTVLEFRREPDQGFVLIAVPVVGERDQARPPAHGCSRLTVRGSYAPPLGGFPRFVSQSNQRRALRHIGNVEIREQVLRLGWIGRRWQPADADEPCVFFSRGLWLYQDERGRESVIAFFDNGMRQPDPQQNQ